MTIVFATRHVRRSAQAVPLAAGSLAAALPPELRGASGLLDFFPQHSAAEIAAAIAETLPDVVCIPLYSWNRTVVCEAARLLGRSLPETFLVAGGPEATADPEGTLAEGNFHAVVRGEGEITFSELAQDLAAGRAPALRPGLSLATGAGVKHGPPRPAAAPEELPSPWLSGLLQPTGEGGVLWETARGCSFACDYCYDGRGDSGVRPLPWDRLRAELDGFVRGGASQIWVLDSTFNFPPDRGRRLLELAQEHAPHIHLHLEAKAEFLDRPTVRLLNHQPSSVQIGLQSFRPEVLRNIHRSFDPRIFRERVHLLNQEGVTFGFDLIYGLPGDDERGFAASLENALALRPNHLDIFCLAVLPATPLHRRREEFGLQADDRPPYLLQSSASLSAAGLERCRQLAAATDLFYNAGRAVAFFPALLRATGTNAVEFLEAFGSWLREERGLTDPELDLERWQPRQILDLQERFLVRLLDDLGLADLLPAARDLLRYHFHFAETLLGAEALPAAPEDLRGRDLWESAWQTSPAIRLVPFHYEILDLLEMGEPDLEQIEQLFRPVGSMALFLRRGNEVMCESLEEDFLTLLRGSDGRRTPREIFAGTVPRKEGEEIVEFAVAEGLLLPPRA
jgi:radical SAM superfamily enzyme YgiQ (UPF0313 family)